MYIILKSSSSAELTRHVKEHLKKGWRCTGGICILNHREILWFYQSLVKEE